MFFLQLASRYSNKLRLELSSQELEELMKTFRTSNRRVLDVLEKDEDMGISRWCLLFAFSYILRHGREFPTIMIGPRHHPFRSKNLERRQFDYVFNDMPMADIVRDFQKFIDMIYEYEKSIENDPDALMQWELLMATVLLTPPSFNRSYYNVANAFHSLVGRPVYKLFRRIEKSLRLGKHPIDSLKDEIRADPDYYVKRRNSGSIIFFTQMAYIDLRHLDFLRQRREGGWHEEMILVLEKMLDHDVSVAFRTNVESFLITNIDVSFFFEFDFEHDLWGVVNSANGNMYVPLKCKIISHSELDYTVRALYLAKIARGLKRTVEQERYIDSQLEFLRYWVVRLDDDDDIDDLERLQRRGFFGDSEYTEDTEGTGEEGVGDTEGTGDPGNLDSNASELPLDQQ